MTAERAETYPGAHVQPLSRREPGWWLSGQTRAHLRTVLGRLGVEVHSGTEVAAVESGAGHATPPPAPADRRTNRRTKHRHPEGY